MTKKSTIAVIVVLLLVVAGAVWAWRGNSRKISVSDKTGTSSPSAIGGQRNEHGCLGPAGYSWCPTKNKCLRTWEEACTPEQALQNYLRDNIAALSPEKAVLGGKFYVTDLQIISPSQAKVSYEDGHIALTATFNYSIAGDKVTVTNFKLVNGNPPKATSTPAALNVTLTFQPMQCQQEPWQDWYASGKAQFFKEPTEEELIKAYYSNQYSITIISAQSQQTGGAACEACGVCKKSYYFTATVARADAAKLEALGWTE